MKCNILFYGYNPFSHTLLLVTLKNKISRAYLHNFLKISGVIKICFAPSKLHLCPVPYKGLGDSGKSKINEYEEKIVFIKFKINALNNHTKNHDKTI